MKKRRRKTAALPDMRVSVVSLPPPARALYAAVFVKKFFRRFLYDIYFLNDLKKNVNEILNNFIYFFKWLYYLIG